MAISDSTGLPIAIYVTSTASPHEVILAEATLTKCFITANEKPERLIGEDKAYDSDPLDVKLAINYEVELIAPHRYNRRAPSTQDGRPLCSYKHSWWKVERLFAWLQNFRHILVRHDYYSANFLDFVQLGCLMILINRCL
jgi:hypothetical protein